MTKLKVMNLAGSARSKEPRFAGTSLAISIKCIAGGIIATTHSSSVAFGIHQRIAYGKNGRVGVHATKLVELARDLANVARLLQSIVAWLAEELDPKAKNATLSHVPPK